jgi:hypothetical protein
MSAQCHPLRRALTTNSAATSFTNLTPTSTEPTGDGVFDLFNRDLGLATDTYIPKFINLIPFGTNGNDDTFDMRLWGWKQVIKSAGNDDDAVWVPFMLADLSIVLGNIAATAIGADHLMADTITVNEGTVEEISTADDTVASILVHLRGASKFQFSFDLAGAQEATGANCYWAVMDQN